MGLIPCSFCRKRPTEKLSQVTWAWNLANGQRVAYRQRLCLQCYITNLLGLDRPKDPEGPLTCPACGIDTERDMDAVYATAFVPGSGKLQYEWPTCAPCAVEIRIRAQTNAERLEDREPGASSGAPDTTRSQDVWAQLGVTPRDR